MSTWTYTIDGVAHDDKRVIFNTTFFVDDEKYQSADLTMNAELIPKIETVEDLEAVLADQAKTVSLKFDPVFESTKKAEEVKVSLESIVESLADIKIEIP